MPEQVKRPKPWKKKKKKKKKKMMMMIKYIDVVNSANTLIRT
jgi:hypothetical protein